MFSVLEPKIAELINSFYQISDLGNWEDGKNILHYKSDKAVFASENGLSVHEFNQILNEANQTLLGQRNLRIRPATDDKVLTSWNALMLTGYVDAFKAFGKEAYLEGAMKTARFLEKFMVTEEGMTYRVFRDGKVSIGGFLDDYAMLAEALINLYEVTFDIHWLSQSQRITSYVWNHFRDDEHNLFFYTSDQSEPLIARKHETSDNVISSSNSVMAHVLYKLGQLTSNPEYAQMAAKMTQNFRSEIIRHGVYYANWGRLVGKLAYPAYEVAILGDESVELGLQMQKSYLPTSVFAGGISENLPVLENRFVSDQTVVYVCQDKVCNLPVTTASGAMELIDQDLFLGRDNHSPAI